MQRTNAGPKHLLTFEPDYFTFTLQSSTEENVMNEDAFNAFATLNAAREAVAKAARLTLQSFDMETVTVLEATLKLEREASEAFQRAVREEN